MTVSEAMKKMIECANGNRHDVAHLLKVWGYARTIGTLEKLDAHTQKVLELTAIVHDISCPHCREKYGNTNGKYQELESPPLVEAFFAGTDVPAEDVKRISYLVSHHHTYTDVEGMDYRILLEADFLVNADESNYSTEAIQNARNLFFRTDAGTALLDSIYLRN